VHRLLLEQQQDGRTDVAAAGAPARAAAARAEAWAEATETGTAEATGSSRTAAVLAVRVEDAAGSAAPGVEALLEGSAREVVAALSAARNRRVVVGVSHGWFSFTSRCPGLRGSGASPAGAESRVGLCGVREVVLSTG